MCSVQFVLSQSFSNATIMHCRSHVSSSSDVSLPKALLNLIWTQTRSYQAMHQSCIINIFFTVNKIQRTHCYWAICAGFAQLFPWHGLNLSQGTQLANVETVIPFESSMCRLWHCFHTLLTCEADSCQCYHNVFNDFVYAVGWHCQYLSDHMCSLWSIHMSDFFCAGGYTSDECLQS